MAKTLRAGSLPCFRETMLTQRLSSQSSSLLGRTRFFGLNGGLWSPPPQVLHFKAFRVVGLGPSLSGWLRLSSGKPASEPRISVSFPENGVPSARTPPTSTSKVYPQNAHCASRANLSPAAFKGHASSYPLLSSDDYKIGIRPFRLQCNCQTATAAPEVASSAGQQLRTLKLHNTMTRQKEVFKPKVAGKVSMYVCGVTAYDYSHIGHARVYVWSDCLFRQVGMYFLPPFVHAEGDLSVHIEWHRFSELISCKFQAIRSTF
jgi:hypothetical protein